MTGASLQAEILARLSESPDGRCICFYGARETVPWQSRSQLYGKSVAVAQQLRQEGLRPGDTCIIVLPSGETSANVLLATLLLGAVPLLIAPPTLVGGNLELHQTLHSAIHRTRPRVVVCSPSVQPERIRIERDFQRPGLCLLQTWKILNSTTSRLRQLFQRPPISLRCNSPPGQPQHRESACGTTKGFWRHWMEWQQQWRFQPLIYV